MWVFSSAVPGFLFNEQVSVDGRGSWVGVRGCGWEKQLGGCVWVWMGEAVGEVCVGAGGRGSWGGGGGGCGKEDSVHVHVPGILSAGVGGVRGEEHVILHAWLLM